MKIGKGQGSFELHPAGAYAGRCCRIIDLGTQSTTFKGQSKQARKVLLGFETTELMSDGRNFVVQSRYTASLHEKAQLRKTLEGWRGRKFTDHEIEERFELGSVLGKPALITIVHSDDGQYANIVSLSPLPAQMTCPPLKHEAIMLSLEPDEFDEDKFESLSDGLKETIAKSPEYAELRSPKKGKKDEPELYSFKDMDDDIPF